MKSNNITTDRTLNALRRHFKGTFLLLSLLALGAGQMWGATIFNCGIDVNDTWYKGTGTINSGHWLSSKTAFNSKNFGAITSLVLGGQYETWDNNQTDYCSWNGNNGIWITIKKSSTQIDNFKLSCYHKGKDGNNNIWETKGGTGGCSDSGSWGTYTVDISGYAAGNDYTIKASWTSPSSQYNEATANFTIPGFTTTSTSKAFGSVNTGSNSSATVSFTKHYGTALTTSNCSITGTNSGDFSVTSISETGVTIQFAPSAAGSRSATLTITDAHGKTCTITLSGTGVVPDVYYTLNYGVHSSAHGTLAAKNTSTSAAISTGASVLSGTSVTFTATPETGYTVEGWYTNSGCTTGKHDAGNTSYVTTISAATNVYVKFVEKTWSVAFAAGTGGSVTTPSSTPQTVGQLTGISIAATPSTGYTFKQWTISSGSGSFTSAATTNSNKFKPTAASTVTASFNETKSTITVTTATTSYGTLKFGSTSKSWGSTASVGVGTTQNITATAASGYRFVRWDLSGAAVSSSTLTNSTITLKANGSGSTGTATAVFEEDLSSPYVLKGGSAFGGSAWSTEFALTKKTGHSTESVAYYTATISSTNNGANENANFNFKIVKKGSPDVYYGLHTDNCATNWWYYRASGEQTMVSHSTEKDNIQLRADMTGSYEIKVDYSTPASPKITIIFPGAYSVTYNSNGATGGTIPDVSGSYYAEGSNVTLATNTGILFKTGKAFNGWNTNAGGTGTHYASGGTLSSINANKTLYAEWKDNDNHMYFYNKDGWSAVAAYMWSTVNDPEKSYPGRTMSVHQGKVYKIAYRSDVQHSVVFNNNISGEGELKTGDLTIADGQSGDHWFYNDADKSVDGGGIHNGWSQYIMVAEFPTTKVAAVVGEKVTITPVLAWAEDISSTDIEITSTRTSGSSNVNAVISGSNIIVSGIAKGDAVFTITYHYVHPTTPAINYTITKTLTVNIKDGIVIQSKVPKTDDHWVYSSCMKLHYWGTGVSDGDIDMTWVKEDASYTYYQTFVPLGSDSKINFLFYYDNFDDAWRKTQDITNVTASGCYTINHGSGLEAQRNAVRAGDQCVDTWQVQITMNNGDIFTSNAVENSTDVISFFAPSNASSDPSYRKGTVTLEHNGATAATLSSPGSPSATFSQSGVYTAKVNTSTGALTNVALYTGNYYIRTNPSHGGWDNYKTDPLNKMTHFNRNPNFPNETFSYYWVDNVAKTPGDPVNIKATVANDYNPVLCGFSADETVTREEHGLNLRFGYEPTTNDLVRGILRGSNENNFLNVIDGYTNNIYRDAECTVLMDEAQYADHPDYLKMLDKSNWVYEINAYAKIDANHKAAMVYLKSYFGGVHYLLGMEKDQETGLDTGTPIKLPIIAARSTYDTYSLRVVYDFKTNRLFAAWAPADISISSQMNVDADVMFLRHEQGDVAQINFANTSPKPQITDLNKAIFAVEIEDDRSKAKGNRELHYFISLPFNCYVKDIFGIGGFMEYWGIQYYDGTERARIGWFVETPTFWKWLGANDMLEAGKGYLLSIDKKALQNANQWNPVHFMDFVNGVWKDLGERSILTLYFPSSASGFSMEAASGVAQTITYPNEPCSITRDDRDQKDSNWKCIGTPGYKNMTMTGYTATTPAPPVWDGNTPPKFLYEFTEQTTNATYAKGTYTVVNGSTFTYHAFHSYMVQYAGTINWGAYTMGNGPAAIAARRVQQSEMNQPTNVQIDLLSEDSTMLDRTFVWLREDATTAYDQNYDLNKMVESKANQIYSLSDRNIPFAANVLPYETDTVPLVVNIYNPGEYTFSLNKEEHFGLAPVLYDMYKSERIDLLSSDYSVELTKGKYTDRFYLLFSPVRPIATDIETTEDGSQHVLSGEAIYDVLGRRVSTITPGHLYIVNGEKRIAQ